MLVDASDYLILGDRKGSEERGGGGGNLASVFVLFCLLFVT